MTGQQHSMIRVLTLNLHCWQEADAETKLQRVAAAIAELRPHIVVLQEVGQHIDAPIVGMRKTETIRADNAALVIAEQLALDHGQHYNWEWYFAHIGFDVWEEGVALLTTFPIEEGEGWYVSDSRNRWNARRLLVSSLCVAPNRYVTVASAHFSWWTDVEEPFAAQFDRAHEIVRPRHENAILAGDFNVRDDGPGYEYMMRNGDWADAHAAAVAVASVHPGGTFPGDIAGWDGADAGRIDYVLWRGSRLRPIAARTLFDTIETRVSDHFGLLVDFEWDGSDSR